MTLPSPHNNSINSDFNFDEDEKSKEEDRRITHYVNMDIIKNDKKGGKDNRRISYYVNMDAMQDDDGEGGKDRRISHYINSGQI